MSSFNKTLILFALIVYAVSPVDLVPGPIDDAILIATYMIWNRRNHIVDN